MEMDVVEVHSRVADSYHCFRSCELQTIAGINRECQEVRKENFVRTYFLGDK